MNGARSCSTSFGRSTSTGPGRPVPARWNASAIACGMSAADCTRKLCLVIGSVIPEMSASWKASVPMNGAPDLAGDRDHRHRVHVGVGDRGDQVGRAGPGGRHADADLAGGLRVPLGRVPCALLVADQDVPHPRGVVQRVVRGQDRAAGDAEHDVAPTSSSERTSAWAPVRVAPAVGGSVRPSGPSFSRCTVRCGDSGSDCSDMQQKTPRAVARRASASVEAGASLDALIDEYELPHGVDVTRGHASGSTDPIDSPRS